MGFLARLFGFDSNDGANDTPTDKECRRCNGWGKLHLSGGEVKTCPRCNGSGSE